MPSIQLKLVSLSAPDGRELFQHPLDLTFGPVRTGLVGRNGTGKTTLLRAILGEIAPHRGSITGEGRMAVLRQTVAAGDETLAAALGVADALARLDRAERGVASSEDLASADWLLPSRIADALAAVGLPRFDLDRATGTLSGGQRTRLSLAAVLLAQPDFLLLDEPTNNLDGDGRAAVTEIVRTWRGGAIVVSHDRELLGQMDQIVELTSLGARLYGGNWSFYAERRAADLAAAQHDLTDAEKRLAIVDRKAQQRSERKARADHRGAQAASRGGTPKILLGNMKNRSEQTGAAQTRLASRQRETAEEDLDEARRAMEVLQPLAVTLMPSGLAAGRTVLEAHGLTDGFGDTPVISGFDLRITGPERVALGGPNGSGKTTLLRLLTGTLEAQAGDVRTTPRMAMLDQQVALLDRDETIRENYLRLNPKDGENSCRAALARFKFRADAALKRVRELSGGEMLRAGLACTIGAASPPELLILDEPTNHLDLEAIAAVEAGLKAYDGALLVVSHDRRFLDAIGITREITLQTKRPA